MEVNKNFLNALIRRGLDNSDTKSEIISKFLNALYYKENPIRNSGTYRYTSPELKADAMAEHLKHTGEYDSIMELFEKQWMVVSRRLKKRALQRSISSARIEEALNAIGVDFEIVERNLKFILNVFLDHNRFSFYIFYSKVETQIPQVIENIKLLKQISSSATPIARSKYSTYFK